MSSSWFGPIWARYVGSPKSTWCSPPPDQGRTRSRDQAVATLLEHEEVAEELEPLEEARRRGAG